MIIDPTKVMVIHNTSYPSSLTAANYYVAARSLNPSYIQGYAFGTVEVIPLASRDAFISGTLTQIRDYINANGIQGIVLSINCPGYLTIDSGVFAPSSYERSLCKIIGNARHYVSLGGNNFTYNDQFVIPKNTGWPIGNPAPGNQWSHASFCKPLENNVPLYDPRQIVMGDGLLPIPCGRMGYKQINNLGSDSSSLAAKHVDDAVWFEKNGNPALESMLVGMSDRTTDGWISWGNFFHAYKLLEGRMATIHTYDGNYANAANAKYTARSWGFTKPPITISNQANFLTGSGPLLSLWGWLGGGLENTGSAYLPSVSFKRGSWMAELTSSDPSKYSLNAGACACICPLHEPFSSGLPEASGFLTLLMRGMCFMEAEFGSNGSSIMMTEAWGDPLYTPFNLLRVIQRSNYSNAIT